MLIIDRFEKDFAVIETGNGMINIPIVDIPNEAKEGDVLVFQVDQQFTDKRKKNVANLMDNIFKD